MPAVPSRRRHLIAGVVIVLSLAIAACTGQSDPSDYGDDVRKNWMEGCTAPAGVADDGLGEEKCGCIYDHVEENMDFSDFKAANSDRREEPTVLEGPGWDEAFAECGVSVAGGVDSDGEGATRTSTEAEGTTTTAG